MTYHLRMNLLIKPFYQATLSQFYLRCFMDEYAVFSFFFIHFRYNMRAGIGANLVIFYYIYCEKYNIIIISFFFEIFSSLI